MVNSLGLLVPPIYFRQGAEEALDPEPPTVTEKNQLERKVCCLRQRTRKSGLVTENLLWKYLP